MVQKMTSFKNSISNFLSPDEDDETGFGKYRFSLYLAVLSVVIFMVWACFANINLHVRGIGKVIPSGKVRTIQHLEGGIIKDILVKEGQVVKKGEVILQLQNTRVQAELREIQVSLDAMKIKKIRLETELDLKKDVKFPDYYLENYKTICESEEAILQSRNAEFYENQESLKKQMNQKVLKLDEMENTIKNIKIEMKNASQQLQIKKRLLNSGAISRSQFLESDSEVKNFNTRIMKLEKEIPVVKAEISEILSILEAAKQNRKSTVNEELTKTDVDIQKLTERIKSFTDAFDRQDVISTLDGVVKKMHVNSINGVLQPGEIIAEIIPIEENLIVEANISTQDRGKIWVGLPVVAKITAYDYSIYGGVTGKLVYISADSFIDSQNNQYYQVRVELQKAEIGEDHPILPGMAVEINVLANKVSILDAILSPLRKIRDNAVREI